MKCKRCNFEIEYESSKSMDWANYEFIMKTGHCRNCLIDLGYCD